MHNGYILVCFVGVAEIFLGFAQPLGIGSKTVLLVLLVELTDCGRAGLNRLDSGIQNVCFRHVSIAPAYRHDRKGVYFGKWLLGGLCRLQGVIIGAFKRYTNINSDKIIWAKIGTEFKSTSPYDWQGMQCWVVIYYINVGLIYCFLE